MAKLGGLFFQPWFYIALVHNGNCYFSLSSLFLWICIPFPVMSNRLYNSSHSRPILNQCWAAPFLCFGELPKAVTLVAKSLFYAVYFSGNFNHESGKIVTLASCFVILSMCKLNVMIWYQCVCSLWSLNSFYVTHHESLLVLFPLSLLSNLTHPPPLLFLCPSNVFPFSILAPAREGRVGAALGAGAGVPG